MEIKKPFLYGSLASFFFAFTYLLNRSMHLSGGSWIWSASFRYFFTLPILAVVVWKKHGFAHIHGLLAKDSWRWLGWSTVGFGLFYAPLSFASAYGQSWLIAASFQMTIVMGVLLSPLFDGRISSKNLLASGVILLGVFLLQAQNILSINLGTTARVLLPILVSAIAYPLGNRKMMVIVQSEVSTLERVYGMTLCSLPFWVILSAFGAATVGMPPSAQLVQAFGTALFSGVVATLLFFKATEMVRTDLKKLAAIESTQAGEVLFTLLGGILFLKDTPPDWLGWVGIFLVVFGMILNSYLSSLPAKE